MSLARSMRRRADLKRDKADRIWPRSGPYARANPDGSIDTLRPTRGWLHTSARRVALRIQQARLQTLALAALVGEPGDGGTQV